MNTKINIQQEARLPEEDGLPVNSELVVYDMYMAKRMNTRPKTSRSKKTKKRLAIKHSRPLKRKK